MKPKTLDELHKEKGFGSGNEAVVRLEDVRAMLMERVKELTIVHDKRATENRRNGIEQDATLGQLFLHICDLSCIAGKEKA